MPFTIIAFGDESFSSLSPDGTHLQNVVSSYNTEYECLNAFARSRIQATIPYFIVEYDHATNKPAKPFQEFISNIDTAIQILKKPGKITDEAYFQVALKWLYDDRANELFNAIDPNRLYQAAKNSSLKINGIPLGIIILANSTKIWDKLTLKQLKDIHDSYVKINSGFKKILSFEELPCVKAKLANVEQVAPISRSEANKQLTLLINMINDHEKFFQCKIIDNPRNVNYKHYLGTITKFRGEIENLTNLDDVNVLAKLHTTITKYKDYIAQDLIGTAIRGQIDNLKPNLLERQIKVFSCEGLDLSSELNKIKEQLRNDLLNWVASSRNLDQATIIDLTTIAKEMKSLRFTERNMAESKRIESDMYVPG